MKALVKAKNAPGLWMEDRPIPTAGPNDLLVQVHKTAVCGTDLHIHKWDEWAQNNVPLDTITGHEFCGHVVEVGSHVEGFQVGDRVSGEGHMTCGHCRNCRAGKRHLCRNTVGLGIQRDGAFAEYLCIPAGNAFKLPDAINDDIASFLDPLGNAVHTTLAFDLVGEDVLITGAGPIGIMAVAVAKHVGARHVVITDVHDMRLDLARKLGASRAVNVQTESVHDAMNALGMTEGFDVGLEMSGNGTALQTMLKTMNHGGRMALLGIPPSDITIDWNQVIFKGLALKGIYGREMFETWYKMSSMLQSGLHIAPVLTHRFPADDFERAFEVMTSGDCGKVLLEWGASTPATQSIP